MKTVSLSLLIKDQKGATAVLVTVIIIMLLGFAALAIDISNIFVANNELQNAADAAALAGARFLYNDSGTSVNVNCNQIARDAAIANNAEGVPVEVNWSGGNSGDIQRGHWSFASRVFTPNDSTSPVDLWNVSDDVLDADLNFINAVQVTVRREATPITSYFAKIFGHESFEKSASAIAYIGFTGTLRPEDVDQPIAICRESILKDGAYSCNIGRMINSGENVSSSETGGWTSFNQDNPCTGGTNAQEVRSLICGNGNPDSIKLGEAVATNGGEIQTAFDRLVSCWETASSDKTVPWNLTLVVVTCPGNNISVCEEVVGAVNVNIIWITGAGTDPQYNGAPTQMGDWSDTSPDGQVRWGSFVNYFHLQNVDGSPAPYAKKSIYFLPDCSEHELSGTTGGENFGILARIPVLVK
ncbi:MAG: TadG family pilus assembly protein [Desulfobacterales bacterium]